MITITGTVNSALCFTDDIEIEAIDQIREMCSCELTKGSTVRIMPDVHAGTGCTIGTTMTVTDKVCPNIVGVDIGCGMYTVKLLNGIPDMEKLDEAAHFVPSGMHVWDRTMEGFDLTQFRCYDILRNTERLGASLGTLGGGNHFIEADVSSDGTYYLVVHSGSRNLGVQVANYYQSVAVNLHDTKNGYLRERQTLIESFRASGDMSGLEDALERLRNGYRSVSPSVPRELCWLYGTAMEDYLHDIEICQDFARRNREMIARILCERASLVPGEAFHTIHNYIDTGDMILRKGSIAAHKGERVLIPLNMRDGSILAVGKGNPEWNMSAPHGAGRLMSRSRARKEISMEIYRSSMEGIYTTSVDPSTVDEAPMAYKPAEEIVSLIGDTVDIEEIIRPVYNFKASEE